MKQETKRQIENIISEFYFNEDMTNEAALAAIIAAVDRERVGEVVLHDGSIDEVYCVDIERWVNDELRGKRGKLVFIPDEPSK